MWSVKSFTLVSLMFFIGFLTHSQQKDASIHFENVQHNFGSVNESDGILEHNFIFTNKGGQPLIVTDVQAGGGISVVRWTRSPVLPGDSGTIKLQFNPENKPGRFNRSIVVSATGNPSSKVIRLLGEIIPREKRPVELYPREIGSLRLRSGHISFGSVIPGSFNSDSLEVINLSDDHLHLSFSNIPEHVTISAVPQKLKPGEKGLLMTSYDAGQLNEWGVVTNHFRILINGLSEDRNIIYISANIQEDFSTLSNEAKERAPVISFEETVFNFGKIKQGESIDHDFVFSNTGESDLIIRRIRSGCGCTAIEPQKTLLKPGETSSIKTVFNSGGFSGRQSKGITVISNDPFSPNIVLRVTGEVLTE